MTGAVVVGEKRIKYQESWARVAMGSSQAAIVVKLQDRSDTSRRPATPVPLGLAELFLRFPRFGTAGHFTLGHVAGQATDVVLENLVLVFQLVVIRLDGVNALGESLKGGLESLGLPIRSHVSGIQSACSQTDSLLKSLASLLAQPLQIGRIATRTHGACVVGGELLLLDFDFGMVAGHQY